MKSGRTNADIKGINIHGWESEEHMSKGLGRILKKLSKFMPAVVVLCFFVLINLAFGNYIEENPVVEQSGQEFLEREEFEFSDILRKPEDYIEQKFTPMKPGLKNIAIRLAVNHAGLPDDFVLLIELRKDGRVIQSEKINQEQIRNWRYYDFSVEEKLEEGEEYALRIRQLVGPKWENHENYWISYVIFHGIEHVPENDTSYVYNGKKVENEFELCYTYSYEDTGMLGGQIAVDLLFLLAAAVLPILKRYVKFDEKVKERISIVLYAALPVLGFLVLEVIAGNLLTMRAVSIVKNLLACYLIVIILSIAAKSPGTLAMIFITLCAVLGLVQYFVMFFRGSAFMIQDIFAVKTAATVAERYIYEITFSQFLVLMMALYTICIYLQVKRNVFSYKRKGVLAFGTVCAMGFAGTVSGGYLISTHLMNVWDLAASYRQDGVLLTMASECQFLIGDKPVSYSVAKIQDILEKAGKAGQEETSPAVTPDNLIIIMNESFSDLENISEIATGTELLPYLHGMEENVIKGYLTVPVFGGGTANTEYEVLTGNTMAFLSGGSPYQMNVSEGEFGLASILKEQGFYAVAAHPYMAENWNRRVVYSDMGFDTFLSEENWGKMELMRWCESDKAAYDKVIELYEECEDKFFTFLVTMQNHGGYAGEYENFQNTVELNYPEKYPQAEQYLSLLQESDKAFQGLVEYFADVEEPTMIVMFGDHLATLEDEFYEQLFGKKLEELSFEETQKRYSTPFVIWTNYDIEEEYDVVMSTNYLGSYILNAAGLKLPPYNQFLLELWQEIPAICGRGILGSDGEWYSWESVPEYYADRIEEYKVLQYNNIYDRKNKVEELYAVREES